MPAPTLFIASSSNARSKAEQLAKILRQELQNKVIVREWWKDGFDNGRVNLASLIKHCKRSDFAAVLLTKDDELKRNGDTWLAPRDNCVFEAGLFIGVFGLIGVVPMGEAQRCFLLTSVPKEKILTDLSGVVVQQFDETDDESLHLPAANIRDTIQAMGSVRRPELECFSEFEVLEREKLKVKDGDLEDDSEVLVNLRRPIEVDRIFANKVMQNISDGVYYHYFFSAAESLRLIAQLVRSVATAGGQAAPETFEENLSRMEKRFRISLLASAKPPEFCIHNANREQAICYLRRADDKKFVEWCGGNQANDFVKDIQGDQMQLVDQRIFRPTSGFDIYSRTNSKALKRLADFLKSEFEPSIRERVLTLCFGDDYQRLRAPQRRRSQPQHAQRRSAL